MMDQELTKHIERVIRRHYRNDKINRRDRLNKMALSIPKKLTAVRELLSEPGDTISSFNSAMLSYELAELVYFYAMTNHVYGSYEERKISAKTNKLKRMLDTQNTDDMQGFMRKVIECSLDVLKEDIISARHQD